MATTIVRTFLLYLILHFAIRIMGKRQIGDMQPGELVITILISEIAAVPIQDLSQPLLSGVTAVLTLIFLEISVSVLTMKVTSLRRIFYGNSAVIINNGVLDQKMLRKLRITGADLLEVLRNSGIFDIQDVAYAILETNGQLSVLLKTQKQPATVDDLNGNFSTSSMPLLVVSDGKFNKETFKDIKQPKEKIEKILAKEKISLKNVFMMTCDNNLNYQIIKKDN